MDADYKSPPCQNASTAFHAGSCSSSSDQGKRGQKRSPETVRKIRETKLRRSAERLAMRPDCICACGCGQPLPKSAGKKTMYHRGHHCAGKPRPAHVIALHSERLKRAFANGFRFSEEAIRKRADKMRGRKQSEAQKLQHSQRMSGRKWSEEIVESRAAPMRHRPQVKPLTAKGPQNKASISGILRSPDYVTYPFRNMSHFVRTNQSLFLPEDVEWYGKGSKQCRALKGLLTLTAKGNHTRGSWKGWTLVSFTETFYNRGETLLSGESSKPNASGQTAATPTENA